MPKAFFIRLFDHWLRQHRADFRYPPMAVRRFKSHVTFRFNGIAPSLWGSICDWGSIVVGVDHQGQCWDFLVDLDIAPKRLPGVGYICTLCDEETRTIYSSREALWIEHGFESLLEWCNTTFHADQQVVLFEMEGGGGTWVKLKRRSEMATTDAEAIAHYPLVL